MRGIKTLDELRLLLGTTATAEPWDVKLRVAIYGGRRYLRNTLKELIYGLPFS